LSITNDAAAMAKMQQAMMLPTGQSLAKLLTPDQLTRFNAFVKDVMGVDIAANPAVAAQIYSLSPATLEAQFTLLLCLKQQPDFDAQNLFDGFFQKAAMETGKAVGGLETLDAQIKLLYQGKSIERQVTDLMCLIDHTDYTVSMLERLRAAFFAQDLEAIAALTEEKMGNACDATAEEQDQLIYTRNAEWAAKLPAIMQTAPTLFAVGAAHLPSERGLLSLLRKAGYEVTAVK